ncbi:hypothetical protein AB849_012730 [Thermoactinomyces vulgaris]|jgi:Bacterial protein YqhG of unknown function|nr:hypothetical protein AB849_012730 [Thermoactinomyces vulgaris]QCV55772.1 hypothetical protein FA954_09190 [Thermoactinomyces vulgaris]
MCCFMDPAQVREWTEKYLKLYQCPVIESGPSYLITQLSIEADKDLLNRPFYWMYVEKMNIPPKPVQLCFIFDPENHPPDIRGEILHYGSPRFQKMLQSAQKHGKFVRLYEDPGWQPSHSPSKPYTPWLLVNYQLSYVCDQKKNRLSSLGINLLNGEIAESFYDCLKKRKWVNRLPPHRYLPAHGMSLTEAVGELEYYLEEQLKEEDQTWAKEAKERLNMELEQLNAFYPGEEKQDDEIRKEKKNREQELVWQFHPRIEAEVINAGLFYMES